VLLDRLQLDPVPVRRQRHSTAETSGSVRLVTTTSGAVSHSQCVRMVTCREESFSTPSIRQRWVMI